jgi:hypothetical protein
MLQKVMEDFNRHFKEHITDEGGHLLHSILQKINIMCITLKFRVSVLHCNVPIYLSLSLKPSLSNPVQDFLSIF